MHSVFLYPPLIYTHGLRLYVYRQYYGGIFMRTRILYVLCLIGVFALFAVALRVGEGKEKHQLSIASVNGYYDEDKGEESIGVVTTVYQVSRGDTIDMHSFQTVFTVIYASDNKIVLKTKQPLHEHSDGGAGINLSGTQTEFVINKGETKEFSTLTMDAGATYRITY